MLFAEKFPGLVAAVAAISPAVWTSYDQAYHVDANSYASAEDFAQYNSVAHAQALDKTPVRVAAGVDDSFYPGVQELVKVLPSNADVYLGHGCHDESFFAEQEPPSLAFLAGHLGRPAPA